MVVRVRMPPSESLAGRRPSSRGVGVLAIGLMIVAGACAAPEAPARPSPSAGGASRATVGPTATPTPMETPAPAAPSPTTVATPRPSTGTDIGEGAPEFTLTTTAGESLSLTDLRGRPVWLVFWAPGCPSCAIEMGMMDAMYRDYQASGLEIVGIAVSTRPEDAAAFGEGAGITYPLAVDAESTVALSAVEYDVYVLPTHYFIDGNGIVRAWVAGDAPPDLFKERLARIIEPAE